MGKKKDKRARTKAAAKKSPRKVVKLATAKKSKKVNGNGKFAAMPKMSTKPYGKDG